MLFKETGLHPHLLSTLESLDFVEPTAIQVAAIAPILDGHDLLATAHTGSGKTAAYALPLLQRWATAPEGSKPATLVVLPTRELAQQVAEVFRQFAQFDATPSIVTLYGGVSINPQLQQLRGGADFVIATPGRLLDVIQHNGLKLNAINALVLDEADKLLSSDFADELDAVLRDVPAHCQRLMLSATLAGKLSHLAKRQLTSPVVLHIPPPAETIEHRAIEVDAGRRFELLRHLLRNYSPTRALVFCATRKGAEKLAWQLQTSDMRAVALYGGMSQKQRNDVLADLKASQIDVLVCTDLAARGIDVEALPLVFNFDLPRSAPLYTHRVGRTGRAGRDGIAISFIDADSRAHFQLIEKRTGISPRREHIAGFEPQDKPNERQPLNDGTGGIKGKRMSKKDKLRAAAAAQRKLP